jgi:16S rRNA (cytosine967-C5)-methyltransferase
MAAVTAGAFYAQDPSSQLVAHLGASLMADGARVVDLCAAPGGKSALLHRLGRPARHVAVDLHLGRARLMRRLVGDAAHLVAADAAEPALRPRAWDLVLLDAPCTGTGTLRRHPELRWRLQPEGIDGLSALQRTLVAGAVPLVAPGGVLLYATCSIEPEENEAHFHSLPEGFDLVDLQPLMPPATPAVTTGAGGLRILPHADGDGFTMHAVRRSEPLLGPDSDPESG